MQENISLKSYNSFGIEATARYFAGFGSEDELRELLERSPVPELLVLGGGSNILLTHDVNAMVLHNGISGIQLVKEDEAHVYLKVGAGENWHRFVQYCVQQNYAGVENLSLIPGNVGASPMQNIGAYGVEIKDVFHELEALHIKERTLQRFSLEDCGFGYRDSVFKNQYRNQFVITRVSFRLNKKPKLNTSYGAINTELEQRGIHQPTIRDISEAVIRIRQSKLPDPQQIGNAGSFFKNPLVPLSQFDALKEIHPGIVAFPASAGRTKLAAGWLIEQCGWKGYRKGDAGCYPKQALVLVNYGQASGADILALSEEIIQSVKEKFGVVLEREVNII